MAPSQHNPLDILRRRLAGRISLSSCELGALNGLPTDVRHLPADSPLDSGVQRTEVLLSGLGCRYTLSRNGRRQILSYFVPGDLCGSLFGEQPFSGHSIATLSATTTAWLSDESVAQLSNHHPRLVRELRGFELTEHATTRQWLVNLGQRDALERTSHMLCELFMRLGAVGLTSMNRCPLPITQTDLADALAISAVHMNRTLMKLRRSRLASLQHCCLTLYDYEQLKSIAGFTPDYLGINTALDPSPVATLTRPQQGEAAQPL